VYKKINEIISLIAMLIMCYVSRLKHPLIYNLNPWHSAKNSSLKTV